MTTPISIGWFGPKVEAWEWILKHFEDLTILREQDIESWLSQRRVDSLGEMNRRCALMLASDFRTDRIVELVRRLEQRGAPESSPMGFVPWCLLLGTDWSGHRRTQPLPETWHTFYWYELYDRLFPWLAGIANSDSGSKPPAIAPLAGNRKVSPRVQRWIDSALAMKNRRTVADRSSSESNSRPQSIQLALILAENADTRAVWTDGLSRRNIHCVCTVPTQLDIWVQPDIIIVDLDRPPLKVAARNGFGDKFDTALESTLDQLNRQFPKACRVVADPFPRWQTWERLYDSGADFLIGKPYCLDGILDSLLFL
ncbi:MAG: hypothetical protein NTU79_19330 [Planctomycetota bacterium]|nr:hypothetical protein [Planctomycetota bacterium]